MKCSWLILALLCWFSGAVEIDNKLLQTFLNTRDDGAVSDGCRESLGLFVENLQAESDQWAIRMLDATSKIPVGLLSLNFGELGQFSQCLSTESEDGQIQGKYCLTNIPLETSDNNSTKKELSVLQRQAHNVRKTSRFVAFLEPRDDQDNEDEDQSFASLMLPWAFCIPRNCSDEDVSIISHNISNFIKPTSIFCQTKDDLSPPLTAGAITTIVILSIVAFLLVASTVLDLYYQHKRTEPHLALVAFSMYTNGRKLFRISKNSTEMTCLNGIRFYSIIWVVIGHVYSMTTSSPLTNYIAVIEWADSLKSMFIASGTLAVDSFFFLSGLLVVYGFIKAKHHGVKFNIFQFYIHRYLRLTPALAVLILVTSTLLRYMGTGPNWNNVDEWVSSCQKYWWTSLLYVQNYANEQSEICLGHTWYLSIDMQLYILSPLILLPLWKYPKIGVSLISAAIVAFIIAPFTIAYITEVPALLTNLNPRVSVQETMRKYYIKTHTRAAPWFVGALLGYVLAKIKIQGENKYLRLNKMVVTAIWTACFAIMLACVFGGHSTLRTYDYDRLENSFYIGFVKPVWAFCLAWVVLACVSDNGGPINWFLSLPIYQVLNRFTYSVYLLHYPLLFIFALTHKVGIYFDELSLAYSFWGALMFSYGLAVIWVLAFESPIVVLEKLIFSSPKKISKLEENGNKNGLPA